MFGVTATTSFMIFVGLGLITLVAVSWIVIGWQRKKRRQAKLARGFERARKAAKTGSGIQGKPYSIYGEPSWSDKARDKR
jgi:hypothetical protein